MNVLFTLAILVAIGAVLLKRRRTRIGYEAPGALDDVEDARLVAGFDALQAQAAAERCRCGGRLVAYGEGPAGDLWVVRARCKSCGAQRALRYRVADA